MFWILLGPRFCHPGDPDHPDTPAEAREAVPEEEGRDWFPVFQTAFPRTGRKPHQGIFRISLVYQFTACHIHFDFSDMWQNEAGEADKDAEHFWLSSKGSWHEVAQIFATTSFPRCKMYDVDWSIRNDPDCAQGRVRLLLRSEASN